MPMSTGRVVGRADRQRDQDAERKAGGPQLGADTATAMASSAGAIVSSSPRPSSHVALAGADAAEVEPQHRAAEAGQRLRRLVHRLRVHRPALDAERDARRPRRAEWLIALETGSSSASSRPAGP